MYILCYSAHDRVTKNVFVMSFSYVSTKQPSHSLALRRLHLISNSRYPSLGNIHILLLLFWKRHVPFNHCSMKENFMENHPLMSIRSEYAARSASSMSWRTASNFAFCEPHGGRFEGELCQDSQSTRQWPPLHLKRSRTSTSTIHERNSEITLC